MCQFSEGKNPTAQSYCVIPGEGIDTQPLRVKLLQLCLLSISPLCTTVSLCCVEFQQHDDIRVLISVQIMYVEKFARSIRVVLLLRHSHTDSQTVSRAALRVDWSYCQRCSAKEKRKKLSYFKNSVQVTRCMTSYYVNFLFDYTNKHCAYSTSVLPNLFCQMHPHGRVR